MRCALRADLCHSGRRKRPLAKPDRPTATSKQLGCARLQSPVLSACTLGARAAPLPAQVFFHCDPPNPDPNPNPNPLRAQVFFHCDQLIRGIYAPFVRDWLHAFPEGALLVVRTEDFINRRQPLLNRVWRHFGLRTIDFDAPLPHKMQRAQQRLPTDYWAWTSKHGPILKETTALLRSLYDPYNRELRDMLAADGLSCGGGGDLEPACDAFLWLKEVE